MIEEPAVVTSIDDQLMELLETMSQRTGVAVQQLISIALWDLVRSFDWDYEEMKQGIVYRPSVSSPVRLPAKPIG